MAKIVIYGDIDICPCYVKVDGGKELTISGKYPRSISVSSGTHSISVTTVSKLERATAGFGDGGFLDTLSTSMTNSTNTSLNGKLDFNLNDVLLIQVKQEGMKSKLYNKLVSATEAEEYITMVDVLDIGEKEPGQKNKWVALLLCFFFGVFGVHRFYEKKIGTGILYLLTLGLFGFGVLIDFFTILFRKS